MASVSYVDGWSESYLLPLAALSGEAADRALKEHTSSVLARVTGARKGALVDGFIDDDTCSRLFGLIEHARELPTGVGNLRGMLTAAELYLGSEPRWVRSSDVSLMWVSEAWMKAKSGDSGTGASENDRGCAAASVSTRRQKLPTARYPSGTLTKTIPNPPLPSSRKAPSAEVRTTSAWSDTATPPSPGSPGSRRPFPFWSTYTTPVTSRTKECRFPKGRRPSNRKGPIF